MKKCPKAVETSAIAAIASAKGLSVATRNVRDFKGAGIEVIDPWTLL